MSFFLGYHKCIRFWHLLCHIISYMLHTGHMLNLNHLFGTVSHLKEVVCSHMSSFFLMVKMPYYLLCTPPRKTS